MSPDAAQPVAPQVSDAHAELITPTAREGLVQGNRRAVRQAALRFYRLNYQFKLLVGVVDKSSGKPGHCDQNDNTGYTGQGKPEFNAV